MTVLKQIKSKIKLTPMTITWPIASLKGLYFDRAITFNESWGEECLFELNLGNNNLVTLSELNTILKYAKQLKKKYVKSYKF